MGGKASKGGDASAPPPAAESTPDDKNHGDKETEVPDIDTVKRKPRDICCLLLFLVAWLGWIIVAAMAVTDGCPDNCNDPYKLIFGFDTTGCMCGKDCTKLGGPNNVGRQRLYIPDPRDTSLRLCIASCPPTFAFDKTLAVNNGVFLCPGGNCETGLTPEQQKAGTKMFYQERANGAVVSGNGKLDNCFLPTANVTDCWYPTYPTSEVMYKCIPSIPLNFTEDEKKMLLSAGLPIGAADFGASLGALSNPAGIVGVWAAELRQTLPLLIIAFFIALAGGFIYLILIRLFAIPITIVVMVGLLLVSLLGTLLLWDRAGVIPLFATMDQKLGGNLTAIAAEAGNQVGGDAAADPVLVQIAAIAMTVFTVVYVIVFILLFKRILIALKVVKEACKALAAMPLLVAQPLCTMVSLGILYIWAAAITMYFMAAGEIDPRTGRFVYSGGSCSGDLIKSQAINFSTSTALLTLSFANQIVLKRQAVSTDAGATYSPLFASTIGAPVADITLVHADLKGGNCKWSPDTLDDRCSKNVNVTSSKALGIGSCLGTESANRCSADKQTAKNVTGLNLDGSSGTPGTLVWNATEGKLQLFVRPVYKSLSIQVSSAAVPPDVEPTLSGTVKLAVPIPRCSDGDSACEIWKLSGSMTHPTGGTIGTWKLESLQVVSVYNASFQDATRACNMAAGKTAQAVAGLLREKRVLALRQGKADLNEVETSYDFPQNISSGNWKSFLPVSLDGSTYNYLLLYHLFMFLWTQAFTLAAAYFVTVGAVAQWYWKMDKKEVSFPISKSYKRYVLYHVGTTCFGSCIIAIVQMIRIMMNYYINQMKKLENNPAMKRIIAALQCILNCCMWCIEKIIGYLNKNAYIWAATHGNGFCTSALKGFMLLLRNFLRVAAINMIVPAIMFFGKMFICAGTFCIVYLVSTAYASQLGLINGAPLLTLFLCIIIGWGVGDSVMGTVEAAVDCIMLSFLHDAEVNNGKDKPYFMADSLQSAIGVSNQVTAVPNT